MLTLDELTHRRDPLLNCLTAGNQEGVGARVVGSVEVCPGWQLPDGSAASDVLAIVSPSPRGRGELVSVLRGLVHRRVSALVLATPGPDDPPWDTAALTAAARRVGLPLLSPAKPADIADLCRDVRARQLEAERRYNDFLRRLLAEPGRLRRTGEGPGPLMKLLGHGTGSEVYLASPDTAGWEDLRWYTDIVHVHLGHADSAAVLDRDRHLLAYPAGYEPPYQVLIASRPTAWPPHYSSVVPDIASQVAFLLDHAERAEHEARFEEASRNLRISIFQDLLKGNWEGAARVAEPVARGVFGTAEEVSVAVIKSAPEEDRRTLGAALTKVLPPCLTVLCPGETRQVITVVPHSGTTPDLEPVFREVVEKRPGRIGGLSRPHPITRTDEAYTVAKAMLAANRADTGSLTVDPGVNPLLKSLIGSMPPSAARWGSHARRGLQRLTEVQRAQAVPTALAALVEGTMPARVLYGVDPTTVSKRVRLVMDAMGLDNRTFSHRAVAGLALAMPEPEDDVNDIEPGPERIAQIVAHDSVVAWGDDFLSVFDEARNQPSKGWLKQRRSDCAEAGEDARTLLRVWLEEGCRNYAAADRLGMSRNSLPQRLDAASALVRWTLRRGGIGQHATLFALVATGLIKAECLPDPFAGSEETPPLPSPRQTGEVVPGFPAAAPTGRGS